MDIGIMGGYGVPDKEFFKCFRVMGKTMDQGLDEKAFFNFYHLIRVNRDFKILILEQVAFFLEFIAADIAFVKERVCHLAFSHKMAAGQVGVPELKVERVVGRNPIKCIKLRHLICWNKILNKGIYIVGMLPKIDIDTLDNPVKKPF